WSQPSDRGNFPRSHSRKLPPCIGRSPRIPRNGAIPNSDTRPGRRPHCGPGGVSPIVPLPTRRVASFPAHTRTQNNVRWLPQLRQRGSRPCPAGVLFSTLLVGSFLI